MSKKITIADDVYRHLASLKEGPRDTLTKVIRRHFGLQADGPKIETGRALAAIYEKLPPPDVDPKILKMIKKRKWKSNRLK